MEAKRLATVFGLLFFASSVIDLNLASRFNVLQFYRRFSADVTENPDLWRQWVRIPDGAFKDIIAWLHDALRNKAQPLVDVVARPKKIIFTDASSYGFGACCVDTTTGGVSTLH